jgi:hypothetical protein
MSNKEVWGEKKGGNDQKRNAKETQTRERKRGREKEFKPIYIYLEENNM